MPPSLLPGYSVLDDLNPRAGTGDAVDVTPRVWQGPHVRNCTIYTIAKIPLPQTDLIFIGLNPMAQAHQDYSS